MSDKKSAEAAVATGLLDDIILERNLIKMLPKNRQYTIQAIKKLTGHNFLHLRGYVESKLFSINKTGIEITEDKQLLSQESKNYCEKLVKKLVFPSLYENNGLIYHIVKLFDNTYFRKEKKVLLI